MTTISPSALSTFALDVHNGLSAKQKTLSSRYFYDEAGDRIFQRIMRMPEYYLTDCEYEIFDQHKDAILQQLNLNERFDLVELGAGDGLKTKLLLKHFLQNAEFEYFPVDISPNVLSVLKDSLQEEMPDLKAHTLNYEYFEALEELNKFDHSPKVILFLGSNIGNFTINQADQFFKGLSDAMNPGDQLICGIDLRKDPEVILKAYNDETGITSEFNINLLHRINRELEGNIKVAEFQHHVVYNPQTGECRSYLFSSKKQTFQLNAIGETYELEAYEAIHMETSRKYSLSEIEMLAHKNGFRVKRHFHDRRNYFTDTLWIKE